MDQISRTSIDLDLYLKAAKEGDIEQYHELFQKYEAALRSFVYRLIADSEESKDIVHDVFLKSFDAIKSFRGDSNKFKSWIFSIASNHTKNVLMKRNRWDLNAQDVCRDSLVNDPVEQKAFAQTAMSRKAIQYEIKEHIDFCFTCISKALPIEQQIAVILKDIYSFKSEDVADIIGTTLGRAKHLVHEGRRWLQTKYHNRCSLINKAGTCYQCDELSEIFKPMYKPGPEKKLMKQASEKGNREELHALRAKLISEIDPLTANGSDLHDSLMNHLKKVNNY